MRCMLRVVIAGGAGFIGSHLCECFLNQNDSVVCLDNYLTGTPQNILHLQSNPNFELIVQDITKPISIDGTVDMVLNFASPASPPHYLEHPIETLMVGSLGTQNLLDLAKQKDAKFMMASTSEIYGDPLQHPQNEAYYGNVNCIGPRSVYDEAKRYAESITMAYHREYNVSTRIIRIFNTYGPRMSLDDGRVVPNFIAQALRGEPLTIYGDGSQTRSFQYVDDLVKGIQNLLSHEYHEPINLGNPHEMTINEFAHVINMVTDNPGGIIYQPNNRITNDPQRRKPDIRRAKEVLGWEPTTGLYEGITRTIEYYKSILSVQ
ncbi:MAG: UDP-glucuronic acid decarboxylase family protein [Phototrophicaceae bacterium]